MNKSQEFYDHLKNQLALESGNSYIHFNLLKLLIDDIGTSKILELLYNYLPIHIRMHFRKNPNKEIVQSLFSEGIKNE